MKVYIVKDYHEMSKRRRPLLPYRQPWTQTAFWPGYRPTPVGAYEYLRKWSEEGTLDFSGIRTVNLDEYKG